MNINKDDAQKLLEARLDDYLRKSERGELACGNFLTPSESAYMKVALRERRAEDRAFFFGGYADAERAMAVYLPEYLQDDWLMGDDSPTVCLKCTWFEGDSLSHRDLLGALMGAGISRESVGDICVSTGGCQLFVTEQIAPYILQNFTSAGRTKLHVEAIPLTEITIAEPETKEFRDTVASVRLDSVISSGFRIGRSLAAQYVTGGKVAIDGLPCEKPDRTVAEGAKISVRGLGKCKLRSIGGQTKKGRISIIIDRYI